MLDFSIATSWTNELLVRLNTLNQQSSNRKIIEIYGSLQKSITGSGRPAYRLPDISWKQMTEHVKHAHKYNIKFNYVMNSPDFQNKENDESWVREITKFIIRLKNEVNIDSLTIAHPFLIKLVKKQFPKLKVYLSLIAGVDSVEEAKKYENMGVDLIYLNPHTINRNFKLIKKIAEAVNIPLALYANIPCLDHCPWRDDHYKFFGYCSQSDNKHTGVNIDPFIAKCSLEYLNDHTQILRSPFIRPEDISEYEKLGIANFKLSDRSESTDFLVNTANSYLQGVYHGNLFNLIFRNGSKLKTSIKSLYPETDNIEIPIIIDNDKLTKINFIGQIKKLRGRKLLIFYKQATKQCVTVKQTSQLKKIEECLKSILN